MGLYKDISGKRFGRLVAIEIVGRTKYGRMVWMCKCDCGNFKEVYSSMLLLGNTKSCGCLNSEMASERFKIHGETKKRIYNTWGTMKYRCNSQNNKYSKYYGDRGIKICDEWNNSYESFRDWSLLNGYEENLTIDRIDNNGNYDPDNCRWVSQKVQMNNTRRNRIFTYKGETTTLTILCRKYDKNYHSVYNKLARGKSIETAINEGKYKLCQK